MLLLNFSHPLTFEQKQAIEGIIKQPLSRLLEPGAQLDVTAPFVPQVATMIDQIGLSPTEWQHTPFIVMLPTLNFAAGVMLAELHGRCGYFPPIVRLRPMKGAMPPQFEVAEIINLNEVREMARGKR